MEFGQQLESEW